jgi:hypothetical protein
MIITAVQHHMVAKKMMCGLKIGGVGGDVAPSG